ncbi:MAG: DUF3306 domain-containing protein [Herminiimonas sp.]|nr:DUF3306 domain-containing protein [Herminiimonas sp.]
MAASDFFSRWAKPGATVDPAVLPDASSDAIAALEPLAPPVSLVPPVPPGELTLADAAGLGAESDFVPFMASNVDPGVRRLALRQLFADPRFNVMDGLDTYIEDYNTFVPMDAAMVAALNHGKALLDPLAGLARGIVSALAPADPAQPEAAPPPRPPVTLPASASASASALAPAPESAVLRAPISTPAPVAPAATPHSGTHDESLPGL